MNDLIIINPASIGGQSVPSVDARHLHERLGVLSEFNHWIKRRSDEHGFVENVDFIVVKNDDDGITGKFSNIDYLLTLRAAMRICVAERTERGDQLREQLVDHLLTAQERVPTEAMAGLKAVESRMLAEVENKFEQFKKTLRQIEADEFRSELQAALNRRVPDLRARLSREIRTEVRIEMRDYLFDPKTLERLGHALGRLKKGKTNLAELVSALKSRGVTLERVLDALCDNGYSDE